MLVTVFSTLVAALGALEMVFSVLVIAPEAFGRDFAVLGGADVWLVGVG